MSNKWKVELSQELKLSMHLINQHGEELVNWQAHHPAESYFKYAQTSDFWI